MVKENVKNMVVLTYTSWSCSGPLPGILTGSYQITRTVVISDITGESDDIVKIMKG